MSEPYPSRVADKIVVRLPDGMRDRLASIAKANNRSVNAEVVARLEASFAESPASAMDHPEALMLALFQKLEHILDLPQGGELLKARIKQDKDKVYEALRADPKKAK